MTRDWRALILWLLLSLSTGAVAGPVVVLELTGAIGPASSDYFQRGLSQAQAMDAQAVVLRLDTPGGLDNSMRDIIRGMLASPVPVIVYVGPAGARAASAGTYILYAAHLAAMAPGTNLGAATPVQLGAPSSPTPEEDGEGTPPAPANAMERKAVNDAVAYIRSLAELRGRNADWAERAVRDASSLSAEAARAEGVIELLAEDIPQLLRQVDGQEVTVGQNKVRLATADAQVQTLEPDWRTQLLAVITNPNVAYILMLLGVYGLFFELMNPGALVPGVLGGICLILALFAFQALPINYAGLGLILLGLAFIIGEAFVPSFGILGIGGVVAFVIGSVILMDTESAAFDISMGLIAGFAVASLILLVGVASLILRSRRRPVVSGDRMVGAEAQVLADFVERGQVRVEGEIWNAVCQAPLRRGERVRVIAREGLLLRVEPLDKSSLGPG